MCGPLVMNWPTSWRKKLQVNRNTLQLQYNTKKRHKTGSRGQQHGKLAEGMGDNRQRDYQKRILPDSSCEIKNVNKPNTTLKVPSDGPREHKIVSTQV